MVVVVFSLGAVVAAMVLFVVFVRARAGLVPFSAEAANLSSCAVFLRVAEATALSAPKRLKPVPDRTGSVADYDCVVLAL